MSERGADFLMGWVETNITPDVLPPEGDKPQAQKKAEECLEAATAQGLSASDLESEVGPLWAYMNVMMSRPKDRDLIKMAFDDAPAALPGETAR